MLSVVIPIHRVHACPWRQKAFHHVLRRVRERLPDAEIVIAEQIPPRLHRAEVLDDPPSVRHITLRLDGETNYSAMRNAGARAARGDVLLILDADVCLDWAAVAHRAETLAPGTVVQPYAGIWRLDQADTETAYAGHHIAARNDRREFICLLGGGALLIRAADLAAVRGYHEGFVGWGGEDNDLGDRLVSTLRIETLPIHGYHLYHPRCQRAGANRTELARLRAMPWPERFAAVQSPYPPNIPRLWTPSAPAVCVAFNEPFEPYAAALAESVFQSNPDWRIEAWAVNCRPETLARYPWTEPCVTVREEHREFSTPEAEARHCNAGRFLHWLDLLEKGDLRLGLCLDADALLLRPLTWLAKQMQIHDLGIVLRPEEASEKRKLRACTVAIRRDVQCLRFLRSYAAELQRIDPGEWYRDQIAIERARVKIGRTLRLLPLSGPKWASLDGQKLPAVLLTCGPGARKLQWHPWAEQYAEYTARVERLRTPPTLNDAVIVVPVFGRGPRALAPLDNLPRLRAALDPCPRILVVSAVDDSMTENVLIATRAAGALCGLLNITPNAHTLPWWQQWALANIGAQWANENGYECILYPDGDIVPASPLWAVRVREALLQRPVVHAWSHCREHGRWANQTIENAAWDDNCVLPRSPGHSWAMTTEWYRAHGGWDWRAPCGGGDVLNWRLWFGPDTKTLTSADASPAFQRIWEGRKAMLTPERFPSLVYHYPVGERCGFRTRHLPFDALGLPIEAAVGLNSDGLIETLDTPTGRLVETLRIRLQEAQPDTREEADAIIAKVRAEISGPDPLAWL